jgi:hypothetical protein
MKGFSILAFYPNRVETVFIRKFYHNGVEYADVLFHKWGYEFAYKQTIMHPAPQQIH